MLHNSTKKKKIYIKNKICGILSRPSNVKDYPLVIFLHGFATDKDEVGGFYVKLAEALAKKNIASFRFDFRGFGESEGCSQESSVNSMIEDAVDVVQEFKKNNSSITGISLVGFSLGAAVAMLSTKYIECTNLILISPALNLEKDFTQFLGKSNFEQLKNSTIPLEISLPWRKVLLGKEFYASLLKNDPLSSIKLFKGNIKCYTGKNDFSFLNSLEISNQFLNNKNIVTVIDSADHIFNLPNGDNKLSEIIDMLTIWLLGQLSYTKSFQEKLTIKNSL